jgi:hypothetical protein
MTDDKRLMGKKSRASGKRFELIVRKDLEKNGWLVFRNGNDVVEGLSDNPFEWEGGFIFKQAKSKWNPFTKRPMSVSTGFPDFLIIKRTTCGNCVAHGFGDCGWTVRFVECKTGKYLDKEEKEKVEWIKTNLKIPVSVAFKGKKRGEVSYEEH